MVPQFYSLVKYRKLWIMVTINTAKGLLDCIKAFDTVNHDILSRNYIVMPSELISVTNALGWRYLHNLLLVNCHFFKIASDRLVTWNVPDLSYNIHFLWYTFYICKFYIVLYRVSHLLSSSIDLYIFSLSSASRWRVCLVSSGKTCSFPDMCRAKIGWKHIRLELQAVQMRFNVRF